LIVLFYQPQKIEPLTLPCAGPASGEISSAIEAHIERTRENKIVRKMLLKKFPIASRERFVRSLRQTAWTDFWHTLC
jgi:hypothetical protein